MLRPNSNVRSRAAAVAAGVLLGLLAQSSDAHAAGIRRSIAIVTAGPDEAAARETADDALGEGRVLVDPGEWRKAVAQQGGQTTIAKEMRDTRTFRHGIDRLRRAATAAHTDAVIVILTNRVSGKHNAVLYAVDPTSDQSPTGVHVRLGGTNESLARAVDDALTELLPPSEQEPSPSPAPASPAVAVGPVAAEKPAGADVPAAAARSNHSIGEELFQVSLGVEAGERRFEYTDGLTPNLRTYQLPAAPLVVTQAEVYPLGGARALEPGITLGYARAFALSSSFTSGGAVSTQWSRWHVGAKLRLRTGDADSPIVSLVGAYGDEAFSIFNFAPTAPNGASMPAVDYRFARASAEGRFPIGRFALFASAGYLVVLSAGDVSGRFPRSTVGGVLAEAGGAFTLVSSVEVRLTASYRRFFYSMHPTPGDTYVAGGALDEFSGAQASVAYVY